MTKIIPAKTFPGGAGLDALDAAAKWLDSQCVDGFVPLHVVARGSASRCVLSGQDGGAIVLMKPTKR